MNFADLLSIAGSVFVALGGGAVLVFALAQWLGGIWAARIVEREKIIGVREQELLVRRRNVYGKLAVSMRVFLSASTHKDDDGRKSFLEAYDEAALWAPDEVMNAVGQLLDLIRLNTAERGSVSESTLQRSYAEAIAAMRRDCGFPSTTFEYRLVSF